MLNLNPKTKIILSIAIIVSISFAVFFIFGNNLVQAQDPFGEDRLEGINLQRADLIMTIINVINWALGLLALIAIVLVLWAGYMWMTAGGNATRVDKAKKILINAAIGLIIIILSWVIVRYVFNILEDRILTSGPPCTIGEIHSSGCRECIDPDNPHWGPWQYSWPGCSGGPLPINIFRIDSITTSCDNPPNYTQDVHLCSAVVINFNHYVDTTDIASTVGDSSLRMQDCGTDSSCSSPTAMVQVYSGGSPTGSGNEWVAGGRSASFVHEDLFTAINYYRLIIPKTISDTGGLVIDPYNGCGSGLNPVPGCVDAGTEYYWTFQTGTTLDDVPPTITSTYPVDASSPSYPDINVSTRPLIWARFSEAIAPWTVTTANIVISGVNTSDPTGYTVVANPQGDGFIIDNLILEPFMEYEVTVTGIEDLCNNPMAAPHIWRFRTNDTAPGVRSVYPVDGYQNACPDTAVFVVFNTSMYNPANNSCDVLTAGGGYVISGSLAPGVPGRNLQVIDDYPGPPANPNDYCQTYEFLPITALLNVNTDYTAGVDTNMIIDQAGATLNHSWQFHVTTAEDCANAPVITRVSPDYGPDGECITIFGRYFDPGDDGQGVGDSATFNGTALTIDPTAWSDTQIASMLPSPSGLGVGDYPIQVTVTHPTPIGALASNQYDFSLNADPPAQGPCLFSLSPDSGCYTRPITARGIRFDSGLAGDDPDIIFSYTNLDRFGAVSSWDDTNIQTQVPDFPMADGDVVVTNSLGISNPLYFDLNCGQGQVCWDDLSMCPNGDSNCNPGLVCLTNGTDCVCTPDPVGAECSNEVLFCDANDDLCVDPLIYECNTTSCLCQLRTALPCDSDLVMAGCQDDDGMCPDNYFCETPSCLCRPIIGPRATNWWPRNCTDACLNTSIGTDFSMAMDDTTFTDANIDIRPCVDEFCNDWELGADISFTTNYYVNTTTDTYQLNIYPTANLSAFTYYRVILMDDILAVTGKNLSGLNFSSIGMANNNSFSWIFATEDEVCILSGVDVRPDNATSTGLYATKNYQVYAIGDDPDRCNGAPLNAANYSWDWGSTLPAVATVLADDGEACVDDADCNSDNCSGGDTGGVCVGSRPANVATAQGPGQTEIGADTSGFTDTGLLTVVLSGPPCDGNLIATGCQDDATMCTPEYPICNPVSCRCEAAPPIPLDVSVLEAGPTTAQECTNIAMYATFNQIMSSSTLNNTNIFLEWETQPGFNCQGLALTKADDNLFDKIILFFKKLILPKASRAQTTMWCPMNGGIRTMRVDDGEYACNNEDGCTRMFFYPSEALMPDTSYRMTIVGGEDGVRGRGGGIMTGGDEIWTFITTPSAQICQIDRVEIIPSSHMFTQAGQTRDFLAITLAANRSLIVGLPGIYDWTWAWSEVDNNGIVNYPSPPGPDSDVPLSTSDMETAMANNVNGQATLIATASTSIDIINYTQGSNYSSSAQITNFICLNPWPAVPPYTDGSPANFSLFYCRDRGSDLKMCDGGTNDGVECTIGGSECLGGGVCVDLDDLPGLNETITTSSGGDVLLEYLMLRTDDSTDAIGLRIYRNPDYLSPVAWYHAQPFITAGSPSSLEVDGYEAIRDGRSVYVAAANVAGGVYPNIYLISYNENASSETTTIYNELLKNWTFNINVSNNRICSASPIYCTLDSECPVGETCDADKEKLTRDTKRMTHLGAIKSYLVDYHKNSNEDPALRHYPKLEAGSYIIGQSTSKWPSWNQTLGSALGQSLPVDPINEFNNCPDGYDPASCWNENLTPQFTCPDGSHIYQYDTSDGTSYSLYANMEYIGTTNTCQDYSVGP